MPAGDGKTVSFIHEHGEVLSRTDEDGTVRMRVRLEKPDAERLRKLGVVSET